MAFRTFCNSEDKECRQEVEPVIDKKTDKVFCPECELEITSIDVFMKRQLVGMGQVLKPKKTNSAYSVKCKSCMRDGTPKLGNDREILCGSCSKDITADLGGPFVQMLKATLSRK